MADITLHSVRSSAINRLGYDPTTATLAVEYHSGEVYHYPGVPAKTVADLEQAKSLGTYFARHVRPHFTGKRQPKERHG